MSDVPTRSASGSYSGKDFSAAFLNRGKAYHAKGDLDRAFADMTRRSGSISITAPAFKRRASGFFQESSTTAPSRTVQRRSAWIRKFVFAFNNRGSAYAAHGRSRSRRH